MESFIERDFGRRAFGGDPGGYDSARPAYPDWVYQFLRDRCDLKPNTPAFEVGAGTGTATCRLVELGANPLVAVEPDHRLAAFLRESIPDKALTVVVEPFEEAVLRLSPSAGSGEIPFALDTKSRLAALERTHAFDSVKHRTSAWSIVLDPDQTVALYATYSNINIRPDRENILAELYRIARDEFHGSVARNMVTSLYVARRTP